MFTHAFQSFKKRFSYFTVYWFSDDYEIMVDCLQIFKQGNIVGELL